MKALSLGRRLVGRFDKTFLLLEIPFVQNHSHSDDTRFQQRIVEEIGQLCLNPIRHTFAGLYFLPL